MENRARSLVAIYLTVKESAAAYFWHVVEFGHGLFVMITKLLLLFDTNEHYKLMIKALRSRIWK